MRRAGFIFRPGTRTLCINFYYYIPGRISRLINTAGWFARFRILAVSDQHLHRGK